MSRRGYGGLHGAVRGLGSGHRDRGALGKSGPRVTYDEATDVVSELRRLTDEAAGHVADYTGLTSQVTHPPVRVVDRRDWAATNVAGLREVITPWSAGSLRTSSPVRSPRRSVPG
ncbi:hypothetical protein GCM10029963_51800 [Micromonospora andamanensis]